jgi:hypothetical protein
MRRWGAGRWLVAGVAAAILAAGVATVIAAPWDDGEPAAATTTDEFFGVSPQTNMEGEDFAQLADAGAGTVRVVFDWAAIQREAGSCQSRSPDGVCDWRKLDYVVGDAAAHGIRVMAVLGGVPDFTYEGETSVGEPRVVRPPIRGEDLEAWKDFVAAAVARYGRGGAFWEDFRKLTGEPGPPIHTWQIWNEPNAERYWPPRPDAAEYAILVAGSAEAIRAADPKAEIVLGGMFGTSAVRSDAYLEDLYAVDGIEERFDAVAIHPYSPDIDGIEVQARWLREVAHEAGDPEVGLWVTELGWSSAEGGHPLAQGEEHQAELLTSAFDLLESHRREWNVRGVIWFAWQDRTDAAVCDFCENAGLFDAEGEPKPAWSSFASAVGA